MKKRIWIPIAAVLLLLIIAAGYFYFTPEYFARGINHADVASLHVFDGKTGIGFNIEDSKEIMKVVETIQNVPMKRRGIFLGDYGNTGYAFSVEGVDKDGKTVIPIFFIMNDSEIYKRPFIYTCDGGLGTELLMSLEPDLSVEVTAGFSIMHGRIMEITDSTMLVEPIKGSPELDSSDRFEIPMEHMNTYPEPKIGDIIEIIYDGGIEETYPSRLTNISHITIE